MQSKNFSIHITFQTQKYVVYLYIYIYLFFVLIETIFSFYI